MVYPISLTPSLIEVRPVEIDFKIKEGPKMPKSSKGSEFERAVCKSLGLWWTQDLDKPRDDIFWRTSQSGGRATERMKKGIGTAYSAGDITFIDPIGQPLIDTLLIELKRGYTNQISILDFLDKTRGTPMLVKWWDKAIQEKVESGRRFPLIIFKRDRHSICTLLSFNLLMSMSEMFGKYPGDQIRIKAGGRDLYVLKFFVWLDWGHPDFFIQNSLGE
jgi:hypothetical protein